MMYIYFDTAVRQAFAVNRRKPFGYFFEKENISENTEAHYKWGNHGQGDR
jgi:hypothetical protein